MGDTESVPNGAKNIDEPLVISVPEIKVLIAPHSIVGMLG